MSLPAWFSPTFFGLGFVASFAPWIGRKLKLDECDWELIFQLAVCLLAMALLLWGVYFIGGWAPFIGAAFGAGCCLFLELVIARFR